MRSDCRSALVLTEDAAKGCFQKGRFRKGFSRSVLLAASACLALSAASPASAQSFLDRLFNPDYQPKERLEPVAPAAPQPRQLDRSTIAANKVTGPKYYTYRADGLETVPLGALATLKTAAAEVSQTATQTSGQTAGQVPSQSAAPTLSAFDQARPALVDLSVKALPEVGAALKAHYRDAHDFVWVTDGAPNSRAQSVAAELAAADRYGLDPADYAVPLPVVAGLEAEAAARALMTYEMRLSVAVLTYALDAGRGRVDPNRISGYHDLPRRKVALDGVLPSLLSASDPAAALRALQPASPAFAALVAERARLKTLDDQGPEIRIAAGTLIKPGQSSPELKNVVSAIRHRASPALEARHIATLGTYSDSPVFSPELVALVKDYQAEAGLNADGIIGPGTIRALTGDSLEARIAKVELALEQIRWLPEDLGDRRVFINQPSFTAVYYEPGKAPLSMRTVIGTKATQTSVFYDEIETVEYNPFWGVPRSILVNQKLDILAKDPGYFDRAGFEVTNAAGKRLSSSDVDWVAVAQGRVNVNVRQRPGDDNALGELKILFPNKHAIYMHDTPSRHLFTKDVRAFSSGCVRLADPRAMAAAVLGTDVAHVAGRINTGKNNSEAVTARIPVYLVYFTAWPQDDGTIAYYDDVYERDPFIQRALEATARARTGIRT
ncbi:L,D-transpeptidase family protein [Microvirga tunisiensis]|uniref:L,D-transpeptidase family protein n=1 Tax=Pannonibacter tanglangensis TaxID=2750084 RepID=A0A7X5F169_9HYPH|nr:L,D-transpeptidase family protein [Pannonibacter sp. XCT-53]NBN77872.1 L,D-transpeptidase family protein [Pannonibacter sp. XCT-53]